MASMVAFLLKIAYSSYNLSFSMIAEVQISLEGESVGKWIHPDGKRRAELMSNSAEAEAEIKIEDIANSGDYICK